MQSISICPSLSRLNTLLLLGFLSPGGNLNACLLAEDRGHTNTQEVVLQLMKIYQETKVKLRQTEKFLKMLIGECHCRSFVAQRSSMTTAHVSPSWVNEWPAPWTVSACVFSINSRSWKAVSQLLLLQFLWFFFAFFFFLPLCCGGFGFGFLSKLVI